MLYIIFACKRKPEMQNVQLRISTSKLCYIYAWHKHNTFGKNIFKLVKEFQYWQYFGQIANFLPPSSWHILRTNVYNFK